MKHLKPFKIISLNENKETYKEIEFVCHNSEFESSSNKESQRNLYNDLKALEVSTNYSIKAYMQDFADESHEEYSLAVIIIDKENEEYLESEIMNLAYKNGIEFDLYNTRDEHQVDSIIKGEYYDNLI